MSELQFDPYQFLPTDELAKLFIITRARMEADRATLDGVATELGRRSLGNTVELGPGHDEGAVVAEPLLATPFEPEKAMPTNGTHPTSLEARIGSVAVEVPTPPATEAQTLASPLLPLPAPSETATEPRVTVVELLGEEMASIDGIVRNLSKSSSHRRPEFDALRSGVWRVFVDSKGALLRSKDITDRVKVVGLAVLIKKLSAELVDAEGVSIIETIYVNARLNYYRLRPGVVIVDPSEGKGVTPPAPVRADAPIKLSPAGAIKKAPSTPTPEVKEQLGPHPKVELADDSPARLCRSICRITNIEAVSMYRRKNVEAKNYKAERILLRPGTRQIQVGSAEIELGPRQVELFNHLLKNLGQPLDLLGLWHSGYRLDRIPEENEQPSKGKLVELGETVYADTIALNKKVPNLITAHFADFSMLKISDQFLFANAA